MRANVNSSCLIWSFFLEPKHLQFECPEMLQESWITEGGRKPSALQQQPLVRRSRLITTNGPAAASLTPVTDLLQPDRPLTEVTDLLQPDRPLTEVSDLPQTDRPLASVSDLPYPDRPLTEVSDLWRTDRPLASVSEGDDVAEPSCTLYNLNMINRREDTTSCYCTS